MKCHECEKQIGPDDTPVRRVRESQGYTLVFCCLRCAEDYSSPPMKECTCCEEPKPALEFGKGRSRCKGCEAEQRLARKRQKRVADDTPTLEN